MNAALPLAAEKSGVPLDFDRVARRYDILTGMNPGYRRHLRYSAERLRQPAGARILDLCCGTGLSTAALREVYPDAQLTGLDASAGMLEIARRKPWAADVRWICGDATDPAAAGAEGPFDAILMAYGIRNVPDPDRCLTNLLGLLAPGGMICFHEYSVADSKRARFMWNLVAGAIIIPSGALTSPGSPIYRYLRRSVLDFDGVRAFERRLGAAGFVGVRTEAMDGWQRGIVHSFLARRPT
ncbi:MAG: class I SAM-dependent methyltransferase [Nannocystis sp.]|jgi:ubiquinone/menaquinone biosynthesis C-methylase UbiE|nr:class I SAM-dependent methyltransferase [Nannocystis sp.]